VTLYKPGTIVRVLTILLGVVFPALPLCAQGRAPLAERRLQVFLDCADGCDDAFIRTETPWVEFVRDRFVADVQLLVTQIGTGGGGQAYQLETIGLVDQPSARDTSYVTVEPNATDDQRRRVLIRVIHLALAPYAMRSLTAPELSIRWQAPAAVSGVSAAARDPWNLWVFRVGADASIESEQRRDREELETEFFARRVANDWKLGVEARHEVTRTRFDLGDRVTVNTVTEFEAGAVAIRSVGPRIGVGVEGTVGSATFDNLDRVLRVAPAVEFSLWPYSEAQRRQLTLQLSAGVSHFNYGERTLFGRLAETRATSSVVIGLDQRQPWGTINASLEQAAFLHDLRRNRVVFEADATIRLTTGLNLEIGGSASRVRDQLNVAARDATPEEVLLELRELGTDYRYDVRLGLSLTFGSIFNSVVNPRFGSGPGSILR